MQVEGDEDSDDEEKNDESSKSDVNDEILSFY